MGHFLASLCILIALLFTAGSWLILPVVLPLIFLQERGSYRTDAVCALVMNLVGVAFGATMVAQLVSDHAARYSDMSAVYPWLAGLVLFTMFLESAIEKRKLIMSEARYWKDPGLPAELQDFSRMHPRIQYWKVTWLAVIPLFLFFLYVPQANLPWLYGWYRTALDWIFTIPVLGFVVALAAVIYCVRLLFGSFRFATRRAYEAVAHVPEAERIP